jgi:hypothetical protein
MKKLRQFGMLAAAEATGRPAANPTVTGGKTLK